MIPPIIVSDHKKRKGLDEVMDSDEKKEAGINNGGGNYEIEFAKTCIPEYLEGM